MIVTAVRTYREVAALLGISHAQVIIDERRALAKIRAALEDPNDPIGSHAGRGSSEDKARRRAREEGRAAQTNRCSTR